MALDSKHSVPLNLSWSQIMSWARDIICDMSVSLDVMWSNRSGFHTVNCPKATESHVSGIVYIAYQVIPVNKDLNEITIYIDIDQRFMNIPLLFEFFSKIQIMRWSLIPQHSWTLAVYLLMWLIVCWFSCHVCDRFAVTCAVG